MVKEETNTVYKGLKRNGFWINRAEVKGYNDFLIGQYSEGRKSIFYIRLTESDIIDLSDALDRLTTDLLIEREDSLADGK
jgi:hypothetical protein